MTQAKCIGCESHDDLVAGVHYRKDDGVKTGACTARAAVRGEPVAEFSKIGVAEALALMSMMRDDVKVIDFRTALVAYARAVASSARAADAPSEPSEHAKFQATYARINHSTPGGGWADLNGGTDDYCEPDVQAAWLLWKSRAADALDSQPTVLAYVATDLDGRADVGMTRQKAMERAGHGCDTIIPVYDLGSSQPTDPNFNSGLTPEEIRARMRHHTRAEKVAERRRRAVASSQPTDGEVRNGCETGRDDEDWFFSPNDGN